MRAVTSAFRRASRTLLVAVVALAPARPLLRAQDPVSGSQQSIARMAISLPGHAAPVLLDTIGIVRDVTGSPDRVFAALNLAYEQLKIPVTLRDSRQRYVGNLHFTKMHRLGSAQLSQLIDCGVSMTGPRADSYRVHFVIVSRVDSLPAGKSRVRSTVVSGAEDVEGPSKEPVRCGSTGVLESRIADAVVLHLKAAPP